ncbi:hypothetical protein K435DRAFT_468735 [Dendrothele bispora CBS 962.96]|uniref:Uncharacterized protein n=1 Tax=Dendrothele bispora (strain CBS 962.96) TaxID=1314807 RepID=A0A4S8MCB9_DENBC|nr:hypothetical protein K435DRAFT_468735 [Dendrothele bispora CBS 962.96]
MSYTYQQEPSESLSLLYFILTLITTIKIPCHSVIQERLFSYRTSVTAQFCTPADDALNPCRGKIGRSSCMNLSYKSDTPLSLS